MPWHELKLLKWKQEESKPIEKPKVSTTTMSTALENVADSELSLTTRASKMATKKKRRRNLLLGKLSDDLDYLEGLLTDVQLADATRDVDDDDGRSSTGKRPVAKRPTNDSLHLKRAAEDAISFLNYRQEFWSQFKPIYSKQ